MLTIVRLSGPLARKYGKEFQFDIDRPIDAIRALSCNFDDFKDTLLDLEKQGLCFRITAIDRTREDLTLEDLGVLHKPRVLRISPVVSGASPETRKGNTMLAIATVLIAASFFVGGPGASAAMAKASTVMLNAGVAFAMSGATVHYAAHQAKKNKVEIKEHNPSYLFSNQDNVTEAGGPVPVGYGTLLVGSVVIGVSMEVHDIPMGAKF